MLPPTVPVIVYHGTQEWNHSMEFADLVDDPGPNDGHVPRFSPLFVNLARVTAEQLEGSVRTVTALIILKLLKRSVYEMGPQMAAAIDAAYADPAARAIGRLALRTLRTVKESEEIEHLDELMQARMDEDLYNGLREDEMTYAEELLQEGFEKGVERGIERGIERGALAERRSVLTRLLSRRFSLTEDERYRIASCEDPDALDAALDEIIVAETKEVVLAKLG